MSTRKRDSDQAGLDAQLKEGPSPSFASTSVDPATSDSDEAAVEAEVPSDTAEATPSRRQSSLFLGAMGDLGPRNGTIREAIHWLFAGNAQAMECDTLLRFVEQFGASDFGSGTVEIERSQATIDTALLEMAFYFDLSASSCQDRAIDLCETSVCRQILLKEFSVSPELSIHERRRRHAASLLERMNSCANLIRSASRARINPDLYDQVNYLAFMASTIEYQHLSLVPKPVSTPSFSPRWKESLSAHLMLWHGRLKTVEEENPAD